MGDGRADSVQRFRLKTAVLTRSESRVYAALLLDDELKEGGTRPALDFTRAYLNRLKTGLQTNEKTVAVASFSPSTLQLSNPSTTAEPPQCLSTGFWGFFFAAGFPFFDEPVGAFGAGARGASKRRGSSVDHMLRPRKTVSTRSEWVPAGNFASWK